MYKIGILEQDESYLWRLVGFLKEHHKDCFEINVADGGFGLDAVDISAVHYDALFLGDGMQEGLGKIPSDTLVAYLTEEDVEDEVHIGKHQSMELIYRRMKKLCETARSTKNEKHAKTVKKNKPAKTSDAGTADGLVMRMIAENFESKDEENARQYLLAIQDLCGKLMARLDAGEETPEEDEEEYGSTEEFDTLQKNAKDSLEIKMRTKELGREDAITYIIRKRTGEKAVINRNLFKMGKDASYVDYCIKDNPAVSRNHADIVRKPDGFYLVDKGSLNHTFINGKKLEAGEYRKLEDGCLMQLADDVFEFRSLKK